MYDLDTLSQVFKYLSFASLHGSKFICLQHPQSLLIADRKDFTLRSITHSITTPIIFKDKSANVYNKTFDIFMTKLG